MAKFKCPICNTEFISVDGENYTKDTQKCTSFTQDKRQNNMVNQIYNSINYEKENVTMAKTKQDKVSQQLNNGGVNPEQYVSLGDLQEILKQIMPQTTGLKTNMEANKNICVTDGNMTPFAKNSRFYNKMMYDGNIFNPYIHRRFIASQYLNMMRYKNNKEDGFEAALRNCYPYFYSIQFLKEEVKKLAFLQWADKVAYEERSHFFTKEVVKEIIADYVKKALKYIDEEKAKKYQGKLHKFIKGRGGILAEVNTEDIENLKTEFIVFNQQIQRCTTYKQLSLLLESFQFAVLPRTTKKAKGFINAFKGTGAYYTLKHLIMFENCRFKEAKNNVEALELLTNYLNQGTETYQFHAMLKELVQKNRGFVASYIQR